MLKLPFLSRVRPRSGYDVVAVIAMCAALGTGGAYAAATIGSEEVVDESLTDADIKNGSLGAAIADQSISAWKLKPNAVWGGHILDGSVSGDDVDESTLGKVPAAAAADTATTAQTAKKATTADSAPIAGYELVSYSVPFNHTLTRTGTVSCPPGKRVLGGTYWMYQPLDPDDDYYIPSRAMTSSAATTSSASPPRTSTSRRRRTVSHGSSSSRPPAPRFSSCASRRPRCSGASTPARTSWRSRQPFNVGRPARRS